MDNDFSADVPDILESIHSSDVVILKFMTLGERLLLDFRFSGVHAPLFRVVPRVRSVAERHRMLQALRPGFPCPSLMALCWPLYVRSLQTSGLMDALCARLEASGYPECRAELLRAFRTLLNLEDENRVKAIRGQGYKTLWSAPQATR